MHNPTLPDFTILNRLQQSQPTYLACYRYTIHNLAPIVAFTCNQPTSHITGTSSYIAMARMQSPTFLVFMQSCSPQSPFTTAVQGPSSFTYMGHLNELQPTITNSQCTTVPNPCYSGVLTHGSILHEAEKSRYRSG